MTVETEVNLVKYLGDDIATVFPFTFPVYHEDHLQVYLQDIVTEAQVLLSASDYSVTGVGDKSGGNVVTDDPVATGIRILIARILPLQQDLDVLNQGGFYPTNVEKEFDLEEMQIQQINEEVSRSVGGPLGEEWPKLIPPPGRRGRLLGFEDDATAYPIIADQEFLTSLIAEILQAGFGIQLVVTATTITIVNTAPGGGSGSEQESWLLENALGGGEEGSDAEFIRDVVGAALVGDGCTITVDDPGDTITITVDAATITTETIYDTIALAITAGTGIAVVNSDVGNTTTISADPEFIRDTIGTAIVGGVGVTSTVSDGGDTITLSVAADIQTVVSAATVTPTFADNQVNITAQAAGLTIANPTGTAVDGHGILIRIKDNGTARAIAFGNQYRAFNDALPTTTVISKTMYIGMVYNAADTKWDVLAVRREP